MSKTALFALLAAMLLLASCAKNEFSVELELPADTNRTYQVVYYASDPAKGWIIQSAITVTDGKGTLQCITHNPTIVYFLSGQDAPVFFIYARRGQKIKISGTDSEPASWSAEGNEINQKLTEWRLENKAALKAWNPGAEKGIREVNNAVTKFVKANPANPTSTLLLLEYFDRGSDPEGFNRNFKLLRGDAARGEWRDLVARNDLLDEVADLKVPDKMVFTLARGGKDTIITGTLPVMLNFSRGNLPGYHDRVKTLREFSRNAGDSTRWRIANVLLDEDSLLRAQNARFDTLTRVTEAWAPLGVSDPNLRALNVGKIPTVIVIDANKKVIYQGDDLDRAILEFKRLLDLD